MRRAAAPAAPVEERPLTDRSAPDTPAASSSAAPARARGRTSLLLLVAAVVLGADVASKVAVVATLHPGENVRVLGGLLYLTSLRNRGAAFSLAEGATVVFSLIAVVVAAVIARTARRLRSSAWAVALGLVLGGALGNLADRIFRSPGFLRGGVVDFLSVFAPDGRIWPVFNLADSAILCGGALGVLLTLRGVEFDGSRGRGGERGAAGH